VSRDFVVNQPSLPPSGLRLLIYRLTYSRLNPTPAGTPGTPHDALGGLGRVARRNLLHGDTGFSQQAGIEAGRLHAENRPRSDAIRTKKPRGLLLEEAWSDGRPKRRPR
jgi:hypothetical protein